MKPSALLLCLLLAGGCAARSKHADPADTAAAEPAHWTYEGETGPDHWAETYPDCALPDESPLDLAGTVDAPLPALQLDYRPVEGTIRDTGHAIQVDAAGGTLRAGDAAADLVQLHFHVPSEHTVDGRAAAGELHLVHRDTAGVLTVVGVLLEAGATPHAYLDSLFAFLPREGAEAQAVTVDAARLLPDGRSYYAYPGSLTTPPCTGGVRWIVLAAPLPVSAEQIEALARYHPRNARPVQPLGSRTIARLAP